MRNNELVHPYLRKEFWENKTNHFWNSDIHSQKSKDYFNKWVESLGGKRSKLMSGGS